MTPVSKQVQASFGAEQTEDKKLSGCDAVKLPGKAPNTSALVSITNCAEMNLIVQTESPRVF